ncbi:hypothetical protein LCGC14_1673170 [marine sediment metagenome]|uniref:Uncharacterized protein n=1 Tax=marine sediment metagenome TaxID=412755 RepID=A0A0F9ID49_9ZZZZ
MPKRDLNPYQFEVALKRNGFLWTPHQYAYCSIRPGDARDLLYPAFLKPDLTINRRETLSRIINARLRNEAILSAAERQS